VAGVVLGLAAFVAVLLFGPEAFERRLLPL
jgi:hypothetical protein